MGGVCTEQRCIEDVGGVGPASSWVGPTGLSRLGGIRAHAGVGGHTVGPGAGVTIQRIRVWRWRVAATTRSRTDRERERGVIMKKSPKTQKKDTATIIQTDKKLQKSMLEK